MTLTRTAPLRCGMDVLDAIYDRRAIRAYSERMLGAELVRRLLEAAVQAPSAMNAQPWRFVVVQDRARLKELAERTRALALERMRPGTPLWEHRAALEDPACDVFHGAGTLIVICATPGEWHTAEDCCLAAQNLMLAAHGYGLGTCPIGLARDVINLPDVKRDLAIPADHEAVLPIVVGHPRERPVPTPRHEACVLSWS